MTRDEIVEKIKDFAFELAETYDEGIFVMVFVAKEGDPCDNQAFHFSNLNREMVAAILQENANHFAINTTEVVSHVIQGPGSDSVN